MYPGLKELVAVELSTLQTISEMSEFRRFDGLYNHSQSQRRALSNNAGKLDLHADFSMDVRVRGNTKTQDCTRWIHVGGLVEGDRNTNRVQRASYSLVIFRRDSIHSPVLRKLHFDYESPDTRNDNYPNKPSSHIQICGKASPHLTNQGFKEQRLDALYPSFEHPRIPAMPMSFGLLLDWLFTEFHSDRGSQEIFRSKRWKNQVIEAEQVVLKPYFLAAASYLGGAAHASSPFVRSKLYEL
jgi:hypothetical protein